MDIDWSTTIINPKELIHISRGNRTIIFKYLKQFKELIPQRIKSLEVSLKEGDRKAVRQILHQMSPQLQFFGIKDIVQPIRRLEHEHETKLYTDFSPTYFITDFPEFTSPFWNMKRDENGRTAKKVDVILSGQETIGSAERETSKEEMLTRFQTIMDGGYRDKLVELFGEERTMAEMDDYLNFNFFERCGGGIGMTRLIRSMKAEGLI